MRYLFLLLALTLAQPAAAEPAVAPAEVDEHAMDNARLQALIKGIATDIEGQPGYWRFNIESFPVSVITDEKADRMRIIVPVAEVGAMGTERLLRLMQANFDSALDARYSIAQGLLWSTFIHPLSALSDRQFIDGLAQTVNLAATYGGSYSSGALIFRGGDSQGEQDKTYRAIIERDGSI